MSQVLTSTERSAELLREHEQGIFLRTDRMFAALMVFQWLVGIAAALWLSPRTWAGATSQTHIHVWAALLLGGAITAFPVFLTLMLPGAALTRHTIAVGQMLTSALLIHLSGGRLETHFHVFGSLAFLAFYRDWRVLVSATVVVAADHFLRGLYWPQSVYGILVVEPWRWLEHAGWVLFEDCFLVLSIVQSRREMAAISERQANLELVNETIERQVDERTAALRQSEAALRAALDKATDSERMKSDFLATMSHEIRTPLNAVIGMSGLLMDTELRGEQRDFAETIRSSADTLLGLINDILDFSKIEAGKLDIEPVPFDLGEAVEEVVDLLGSRASEKNLDLVLRFGQGTPNRLIGDPGRLRQVLTNLVSNALKFTERGHVLVNVECERRDDTRAWIRFAVEDTGIGIPAEKQRTIFERFMQADTSTTRRYGGTRLGLAICKQLVELMDGELSVRSEPGQGSTFQFLLPLPIDAGRQQLPAAAATDLIGVRVLIVDDNAVNRRVLHELITRWGMRNGGFASGADALVALHTARESGDPYQIAILDMNMPGMDGEMLGRAIKADPELKDTVLMLLTSSAKRGDARRMMEIGFSVYMTKPVRPSVLMDALASAWSERVVRGEAVRVGRRSALEPSAASLPHGDANRFAGVRILLVEDNIANQKVARLLLERIGCRVEVAANGKEALETVKRMPFDLVFMDCQMPVMDGYEATRAIRALPNGTGHGVIVAMTAHATQGSREECLAAGMDDYVTKPVRREVLESTLAKWTGASAENNSQKCGDSDMEERLQALRSDGGDEFVADLAGSFLAKARNQIAALAREVRCGNVAEAKRIVHDLKGSSGTLGAMRVAAVAQDIEKMLMAGGLDAASVHSLQTEFARIEPLLARYSQLATPPAQGVKPTA